MADPSWDRVEPHTRDVGLEEGLQARLADPLWGMARQWQVGEFRGEDAASPVHLRLQVEHVPLVSVRNEAVTGAAAEPLADGRPLEARVEAEAVPSARGRIAFAAESGLQFLHRLDHAGLDELRGPLRKVFGLVLRAEDLLGLPQRDQRRVRRWERGALDGLRLLAAGVDGVLAAVPEADREDVRPVYEAWRLEHRGAVDQPPAGAETWVDEDLAHCFSIAAPTATGEVALGASGYPGGRLDWYAFDVGTAEPHGIKARKPGLRQVDVLPTRLAYRGMPAPRFWQLEQGSVYFGGVAAGPTDLGRLLVAEYAAIGADDWLLAPVRLPFGSLGRVVRATIATTFGERVDIRSTAQWDAEAKVPAGRRFAFFELSGDDSATRKGTPWLLLAPVLASTQEGPPLEAVSFVRDEAANVAWAVEERVESAGGGTVRRRLMLSPGGVTPSGPDGDDGADPAPDRWRYRLQSNVPANWVPLVPERPDAASAEVVLRRARMLSWQELDEPRLAGALGRILAPDRPLTTREESIPAEGALISRRWQAARGTDGRLHVWLARRRRPGRGERGSGLAFDSIVRET